MNNLETKIQKQSKLLNIPPKQFIKQAIIEKLIWESKKVEYYGQKA